MFYRLPQRLAQALPRRLDYRRLGEMGPDLEIWLFLPPQV